MGQAYKAWINIKDKILIIYQVTMDLECCTQIKEYIWWTTYLAMIDWFHYKEVKYNCEVQAK